MYISPSRTFTIDKIVKSFEVAFRSFIAKVLYDHFSSLQEFESALVQIESNCASNTNIFSQKNLAKIRKIKSEYREHYKVITDCYNSYLSKDFNNDVPYVSNLIDYINLFYNRCFSSKNLVRNFISVEEFHYNCSQFVRVRNALSHPASTKILTTEAASTLTFVTRICNVLDDEYFWYIHKDNILDEIEKYHDLRVEKPLKIDNLSQNIVYHRKVVCREDEFETLDNYIVGKNSYCRVAGSVVLFGYGGVGKTAIVVDYIQRLIRKLKEDNNELNYDFILFYSSKDEYLKQSITTGELYIDKSRSQIEDFESFKEALFNDLSIERIEECGEKYKGGVVVIDNIENIPENDKTKIFEFIKETPRNVQYIITSRNEEPCEEKLHVKEFRSHERGSEFIRQYIRSEDMPLDLDDEQVKTLVESSRGNALILVQCLSSLNEQTASFEEIISNLENIKSKSVEVIADFMYKNTFEKAISELESQGHNPKKVIRIISLYREKIDLYSISKLSAIDIGTTEIICQHLLKKLIINKSGEYYTINEFANSFIFIKLLPNNYETNNILISIRGHKESLSDSLKTLSKKCSKSSAIKTIMDDWKPRNYIDRIVIAEAFETYDKTRQPIKRKDIRTIKNIFDDYSKIELVTNHPYIRFQKARIYRNCLKLFKGKEYDEIVKNICRSYEDAIEAIQFTHPFIRGTNSHGAVLMLYGIFLGSVLRDNSRSIRYLEEASDIFSKEKHKNYFSTLYYLTISCLKKYEETNDPAFRHKLIKAIKNILENKEKATKSGFDVRDYEVRFKKYL